MKTKISLILAAALCSASVMAQEAMNVEGEGGKILKSAALSDNMVVTFSDDQENMIISENGSELKRIAIDDIERITFGELKAESNGVSQISVDDVKFTVFGDNQIVVASDKGLKSVKVYGTDGKMLPQSAVSANGQNEYSVSLLDQPKGICIVVAETEGGVFTQKVLINK